MSGAFYPSLVFTVAMLVTNAYFLVGGLPLLILQHDTALDARFVGGFFNLYCKAALGTALGAAVSYAFWGLPVFAAGALGLALVALALRWRPIPALQHLGQRIQHHDGGAVRRFRRVHGVALLVNLLQLGCVVWTLTKLPL